MVKARTVPVQGFIDAQKAKYPTNAEVEALLCQKFGDDFDFRVNTDDTDTITFWTPSELTQFLSDKRVKTDMDDMMIKFMELYIERQKRKEARRLKHKRGTK